MATSATDQMTPPVDTAHVMSNPVMKPSRGSDNDRQVSVEISNLGKSSRRTMGQSSKSSKILLESTRNFGCVQRPSREEIDQYKELFYQLIERVPASEKRLISAMLARGVFTPRPVALYLAQDKPDVAAPFLLYSPVLGDLDLRAIAKKKGAEHAAIVAKRRLPMDNFTKSTLHEVISTPHQPVQEKAEPEFIEQVLPAIEPATEPKWLEGEEIVALASIGGRLGRQDKVEAKLQPAPSVKSQHQTKVDFQLPKTETRKLLQLARQRKIGEVAAYVEGLCGLETSATLKLVKSQQTELTYLVKALGLSAPHDIQLLMMLSPGISRDVVTYRETKNLLTQLDVGICRMIFNEIGARFDVGTNERIRSTANNPESGFSQAIQRRRDSLERAPLATERPTSSRFSFEQSFLAAG